MSQIDVYVNFRHSAEMTDAQPRDLIVPAGDGFALAATLTPAHQIAATPPAAIVIIGSAAAVPRRYYARFAQYAAERGIPVLTFDYRGVGGSRPTSLKGFKARMRDWGETDIPGVLAWAHRTHPQQRILWLGHSYGGFGTGLAYNNALIRRQLSVATFSGHWPMMRGLERYRVAALMGFAVPPLVRAMGRFPGRLMGAEDLPRDVFLEWARWVMTPHFVFGDETLASRRHFATFTAPMRFAQIEDDAWGSDEAVRHMMGQWPAAAERSLWHVRVTDSGAKHIGHLGFFRAEFRDTLWLAALNWLLDDRPVG